MKNQNLEIWGSKSEMLKICDSHFAQGSILLFSGSLIAYFFKIVNFRNLQHLPVFYPKRQNMTSLKRHFLQNFSTDFYAILVEDVKLMPENVLEVSRRYLPPFLSYRVKPAGGRISPPPPSGQGRNHGKSVLESLPGATCGGRGAFINGAPSGKYTISRRSLSYFKNLLLANRYALCLEFWILII